jgi:hypothetical protein
MLEQRMAISEVPLRSIVRTRCLGIVGRVTWHDAAGQSAIIVPADDHERSHEYHGSLLVDIIEAGETRGAFKG